MEEAAGVRYWCHLCYRIVNPMHAEVEIKCPLCNGGFVEQMPGSGRGYHRESEFGSDRGLSHWAPILLGMMDHPRSSERWSRPLQIGNYNNDGVDGVQESFREMRVHLGPSRRRRGNSARVRMDSEQESRDGERDADRGGSSYQDWERERDWEIGQMILINYINENTFDDDISHFPRENPGMIGSLGDYFGEPRLDLLLQHLAESDPNVYGTPPALKEAVEAMPTVTIEEKMQCSVCLDDLEIGEEAREMPCYHKFHCGCIMPWLELHSSCPVCRYQLPADESKLKNVSSGNGNTRMERRRERERGMDNEGDRIVPINPMNWPFFSSFQWSGESALLSASSSSAVSSASSSSAVHNCNLSLSFAGHNASSSSAGHNRGLASSSVGHNRGLASSSAGHNRILFPYSSRWYEENTASTSGSSSSGGHNHESSSQPDEN
ncbi:hypothetical protein SAY86_013725 [Trapa natans]|uniref:RING-type E3 ubiquitin transferase n=1 Tax=Trapa natans TaxID=22666 RepID=A0AAN7QQR5_TRANT|nr:hypothetical protein SAY86_013725 [Trapa natans]